MFYTKKYTYIYIYNVMIIMCLCFIHSTLSAIHGRYTKNIENYELSIPHRVSEFGEFLSFKLPKFFAHNSQKRYKREAPESEKLYYNIIFAGKDHHLEIWPNHGFISPNVVSENYRRKIPVNKRNLKRIQTNKLCHFIGKVKGDEHSSVAVSLCDGLAGYFLTKDGHYFIEPIAEHEPNEYGQHVHVVFKRTSQDDLVSKIYPNRQRCGLGNDWEDAWAERLRERRNTTNNVTEITHTTRHYIELLIVVDKKFIDYHKHNDLEQYILTIINMVYAYFDDASIGSDIEIQVVRMIYLDKIDENLDISINQNARATLNSFCNWTASINPTDFKNPQRHDVAILITRFDLCSDNNTDCSVMGIANVAGACDTDRSCAVNEDNGLELGVTITHEMGHLLGAGHDGPDSLCDMQTPCGDYYIMAPSAHMATIKWSPCSKKFISEFFENGLGECLEDVPEISLFDTVGEMLPGAVYDADYQCENIYPGTKRCFLEHSKICEMLWCKTKDSDTCYSNGDPPADGTKCGENMWCYRNKCVRMGTQADKVDGGWGEWGEWSKCSRTCGGGISYSERYCENPHPQNHGLYCVGEKRRIKMCNTDDCVLGPSYRQIQCMIQNDIPFKNKLHAWKPYRIPGRECQLACINEEDTYTGFGRAKDGTPCKPGLNDRCIFGKCHRVGCDWIVDSPAIEDICGICNGDGTHCKIVEKEFTEKIPAGGYYKFDVIPSGARNIYISEKEASPNTIAVASEDGKTYYLNGDFSEELNGDKYFGSTLGIYEHPSPDKEILHIPGPLKEPIVLYEVFYNRDNPGIKYSYTIPTASQMHPIYIWEFTEYSPCSAFCDWGYRTSKPVCVEKTRGEVIPKFCEDKPKPDEKIMECFIRECKTKWHPNIWGKCNGCKNKPGVKTRTVDCVKEAPNEELDPMIVDDSLCTGPKPKTQKMCCSDKPCPPEDKDHPDEVQKKMESLGYQLQRIRHKIALKKKKNTDIEIFTPERHEIRSGDLRNVKQIKEYLKEFKAYKRSDDKKSDDSDSGCATPETSRLSVDRVPFEGQQLVEVPIIQDSDDIKLSDVGIERSGDKVPDELNFCKAKLFKGKEADDEIKRLKNTCNNPTIYK